MEEIISTKEITCMYSHAFFTCDCGREVIAATIDNSLYKGRCDSCGLHWELKNNRIRSMETA
jgi:DNA replicative helicase MCM subunit Mcm2 (Cdc46/Mcm family)